MALVIFGGGVMGEAILSGFLAAGVPADGIAVAERSPERRAQLSNAYRVRVFDDNRAAARWADTLWIVVKPQDALALVDEIASQVEPGNLVVSLCAGLTTDFFSKYLSEGTAVVRVMPNTPARISEGMSAVSAGAYASEKQVAEVVRLIGTVGDVVVVPESQLDAVTAVSGSGPAYLFAVAEAMIEAGERLGFDQELARYLVRQTVWGSAGLLYHSGEDAAELRRKVTSEKGTTAAALEVFDRRGLKKIFAEAMEAAARRSVELSQSNSSDAHVS